MGQAEASGDDDRASGLTGAHQQEVLAQSRTAHRASGASIAMLQPPETLRARVKLADAAAAMPGRPAIRAHRAERSSARPVAGIPLASPAWRISMRAGLCGSGSRLVPRATPRVANWRGVGAGVARRRWRSRQCEGRRHGHSRYPPGAQPLAALELVQRPVPAAVVI